MAGEEMINLTRLGDYNNNMLHDAHILKRSTAYVVDDKVNKGLIYLKCTQAGTTASTALDLTNVSVGDTLTDGAVTWKVLSIKGVPEGGGTGAGLEDWQANHNYAVDDIYVYEGEIYKTLVKFTSGATEDSRTKVNDVVPSVWTANTAYTAGDIIEHTDVTTLKKVYYDVTANFTSGATFEVTAEMQELQIVEEYVPNPLTHIQVKNLINNFAPSGSGTDPIFYNDSPIGTIIAYMGITAPKDYLACDGQTYNIVDYKELAEYIKVQFGSYNKFGGDGTTTFAVPDLRGEFLRGTGTNSHTNSNLGVYEGSGSNVGVHQSATGVYKVDGEGSNVYVHNATTYNAPRDYDAYKNSDMTGTIIISHTAQSGATVVYTTRPTNTSVLYCIKYNTSVLSTPENNYSTEEQRIGTWIDGKPLYQKTIIDIMPVVPDNGTRVGKTIDVSVLSVENCVKIDGFIRRDGGTSIENVPINMYQNNADPLYTFCEMESDTNSSILNHIFIATTRANVSEKSVYITIQYTKTTD